MLESMKSAAMAAVLVFMSILIPSSVAQGPPDYDVPSDSLVTTSGTTRLVCVEWMRIDVLLRMLTSTRCPANLVHAHEFSMYRNIRKMPMRRRIRMHDDRGLPLEMPDDFVPIVLIRAGHDTTICFRKRYIGNCSSNNFDSRQRKYFTWLESVGYESSIKRCNCRWINGTPNKYGFEFPEWWRPEQQ
jgi:hypothetical protein